MGTVIWFTGLSGSGKTTIALELQKRLEEKGRSVSLLDADVVRETLHKNLGFSREDIGENNRLIAALAKEHAKINDFVLVPIISPYQEDRTMVRSIIGHNFIELFVNCPLEKCIEKDVKGLYKKAFSGEIPNFIGIAETNPYEIPLNPDLSIRTDQEDVEKSTYKILKFLQGSGLIS